MLITRSPVRLRSDVFTTLPRDSTKGVSIVYTDTAPDERISAVDMDGMDCRKGYFGCTYHLLVKPSGCIELGRPLANRTSRGSFFERQENIFVGVIGGRDEEGHRISTVTQAQRDAIEEIMQRIADILQTPLEVSDYVENKLLRDQQREAEEAELAQEEALNIREAMDARTHP